MALDITIIKKENYSYLVELKGSIDTDTHDKLEKEMKEIIDDNIKAVVFDMASVDYVSSMGLGVVVWVKKTLERRDAIFTMINLQPQIKKLFDLMKLAPNIKIHDIPAGDKYIDQIIKEESEKQGE